MLRSGVKRRWASEHEVGNDHRVLPSGPRPPPVHAAPARPRTMRVLHFSFVFRCIGESIAPRCRSCRHYKSTKSFPFAGGFRAGCSLGVGSTGHVYPRFCLFVHNLCGCEAIDRDTAASGTRRQPRASRQPPAEGRHRLRHPQSNVFRVNIAYMSMRGLVRWKVMSRISKSGSAPMAVIMAPMPRHAAAVDPNLHYPYV